MQSPALEGVPKVGSPVKVNALRLENGLLFARKIEGEVEDQGVTQCRVEIRGVIERIEQDRTIVIDTVPVKIVALTEVEGELNEGVFAQVEAFLLDDKTLVARAVRVEETDEATERSAVRFEGTVEKVNDDDTFVVNGIKVTTTARSDVKGDVTEGASVQIEGVLSDDGSVMAEVLRGENRRATESRPEVKIEGAIEAIRYDEQRNARFLVVNGLPISLQALTDIAVSLKPGIQVIVRGILHDGVLVARDIRPQETRRVTEDLRVRLAGEVQAIQVNDENEITGLGIKGVRVQIQRLTKIEATLRVGSLIEVVGTVREGGILALTIKGLDEESPNSDGSVDQTDEVKEVGLRGPVEALRRDVERQVAGVLVSGVVVILNRDTVIRGTIEIGVTVEIKARIINGVPVAKELRVIPNSVITDATPDDTDKTDDTSSKPVRGLSNGACGSATMDRDN